MGGRHQYALLSGALLAAALAAGASTWLEWLPCRGSMLSGSLLLDFQYPTDFTDACLARMDRSDTVPLAAGTLETRALSALLLGLGWLGFAAGFRLPAALRTVVLLPVVPISWFAVETWLARESAALNEPGLTIGLIEVTALLAAVVIIQRPAPGRARVASLIGLWAVASYGLVHYVGDHLFMVAFSDANWDVPPGAGYPTAATIAVCALLVALLGWRVTHPGAGGRASDPVNASTQTVAG